MSWWGKLIGGYFGFYLGGPIGALIGLALGHSFVDNDTGTEPPIGSQNRAQTAFFTATFYVMGRICKADGRITEDEIHTARIIMSQMKLSAAQKEAAIALFNAGKKEDFPLTDVLSQLKAELGRAKNIKRAFVEIQCYAAYADNTLHPDEERLLKEICHNIGVAEYELKSILAAIATERKNSAVNTVSEKNRLNDAYTILNVSPSADDNEIKRSYRRLMSKYHPDKLVAKGLPEEMLELSTRKTQDIRQAYEKIMRNRK